LQRLKSRLRCHILLKYDFKLAEGTTPTVMKMGWNLVADPMAQLMIKRREGIDESVGTEKRREKVVVLRELQRAIIYNE
jgi:hypothetical protein